MLNYRVSSLVSFASVLAGLWAMGCGSSKSASYANGVEGNESDECADEADNDRDGLFDCDDPDCAGSAICNNDGKSTMGNPDSASEKLNDDSEHYSNTDGDTSSDLDSDTDADTENMSTDLDTSDWVIPTNPNAPVPMPVISRGVPVFTSDRPNGTPNDAVYTTYFWIDASVSNGQTWLAYDLSRVPKVQRGKVLVHWVNDSFTYSQEVQDLNRCPRTYTIDAHAAEGGGSPPNAADSGWTTLAAVTEDDPNLYHSRQHVVDLTTGDTVFNWIRIYVTSTLGLENLNINMDIHDAHLGVEDAWIFYGDSLTAGAMRLNEYGDENFPQIINKAFPQYFPAQENAGVGNWMTADGAQAVPRWVKHSPARYAAVSFGTNDASANLSNEEFLMNYGTMIRAIIDAGKIPIVPTIPWCRQEARTSRIQTLNEQLVLLKQTYPEIVDGPDLWTLFYENQDLIGTDNLHPTEPEGDVAYRRAWAETMISIVYGQ